MSYNSGIHMISSQKETVVRAEAPFKTFCRQALNPVMQERVHQYFAQPNWQPTIASDLETPPNKYLAVKQSLEQINLGILEIIMGGPHQVTTKELPPAVLARALPIKMLQGLFENTFRHRFENGAEVTYSAFSGDMRKAYLIVESERTGELYSPHRGTFSLFRRDVHGRWRDIVYSRKPMSIKDLNRLNFQVEQFKPRT